MYIGTLTVKYVIKNLKKCRLYADFQHYLWYTKGMENKRISIDELNNLSKETISLLYLQTFEMLQNLQAQNANLIAQVEVVNHYLPEDILNSEMPKGWHQLEDEIYTELERIPPSYKAVEHHIGVYASNGNGSKIMRGKAPSRLLNHSILTPSFAASIFTAKYINAVPLNRISEGYGYDGLNISRQVMAGWMIRLSDYYLDSVHQMMNAELKKAPLIHCDETPFIMSGEKDAQDPQSKDYMWVYHSPGIQDSPRYICMNMIMVPDQPQ